MRDLTMNDCTSVSGGEGWTAGVDFGGLFAGLGDTFTSATNAAGITGQSSGYAPSAQAYGRGLAAIAGLAAFGVPGAIAALAAFSVGWGIGSVINFFSSSADPSANSGDFGYAGASQAYGGDTMFA